MSGRYKHKQWPSTVKTLQNMLKNVWKQSVFHMLATWLGYCMMRGNVNRSFSPIFWRAAERVEALTTPLQDAA